VCRGLTDAGQFPPGGRISTVASLTGSFALTRERPPSQRPVPLGGKTGGKIVKRRARRVVRWIVLHVIEETAAHSGHREIARELLDGKTRLGGR
jgi:Protein of unknown function (DUF664)